MLISGCASVPSQLDGAKRSVDDRFTYSYRVTSPQEEVARGIDGTANCTRFSMEYYKSLISHGVQTKRIQEIVCRLPDGTPHRYLVVDGQWVLDNRFSGVMPVEFQDCR